MVPLALTITIGMALVGWTWALSLVFTNYRLKSIEKRLEGQEKRVSGHQDAITELKTDFGYVKESLKRIESAVNNHVEASGGR